MKARFVRPAFFPRAHLAAGRLLTLALLAPAPAAVAGGDWLYTSTNEHVTITGYLGAGGVVVMPEMLEGKLVTKIAPHALQSKSTITRLTLPNTLVEIGVNGISDCALLTSVTLGTGVTTIAHSAFHSSPLLSTVFLPEGLQSVGAYAFANCPSLTTIMLPPGITDLPTGLFQNCTGLTHAGMPANLRSIGYSAFRSCINLPSVVFQSGVQNIEEIAFYECPRLTHLYFQGNAPTLNGASIFGLSTNTTVYASAGRTGWGATFATRPVGSWDSLYGFYGDGLGSIITGYSGPGGVVTIPDTLAGLPVVVIDEDAFNGQVNLTRVTLPDRVTEIRKFAFYSCQNLAQVTFGHSLTHLGVRAFAGCSRLTGVSIPDGVTTIGTAAFSDCTSLESAYLGNGLTDLGDLAFANCPVLDFVLFRGVPPTPGGARVFENSPPWLFYYLGTVGWGGFYLGLWTFTINPFHLQYATDNASTIITGYSGPGGALEIPATIEGNPVTGIGDGAFQNLPSLSRLTVLDGVTSIGSFAFAECENLTQVTLPHSVTNLGNYAFARCASLPSIALPNRLTHLGTGLFSDCFRLEDVRFPDELQIIGAFAFSNCSGLTRLRIPASVTGIGSNAFEYCTGLLSLSLSDRITRIGARAFLGCDNLVTATLGDGSGDVVLGENAFQDCTRLTHVYFKGHPLVLGDKVFLGSPNVTVYFLDGYMGWPEPPFPYGDRPTAHWTLPQIFGFDRSGGAANALGLNIAGFRNMHVVVEACANLADPVWEEIGDAELSAGLFILPDPLWTNFPSRIYRARVW